MSMKPGRSIETAPASVHVKTETAITDQEEYIPYNCSGTCICVYCTLRGIEGPTRGTCAPSHLLLRNMYMYSNSLQHRYYSPGTIITMLAVTVVNYDM